MLKTDWSPTAAAAGWRVSTESIRWPNYTPISLLFRSWFDLGETSAREVSVAKEAFKAAWKPCNLLWLIN